MADGEYVYRVPPLEVLEESEVIDDASLKTGALRLFVARVRASEPGLVPDRHFAATAAAICRRLDGIPLAIELAATRCSALGIDELAARLDDRFRLLSGGRRTALPRHQTLRATFDWSHDLLSDAERIVLRRLAVFAGSFKLPAAIASCPTAGSRHRRAGASRAARGQVAGRRRRLARHRRAIDCSKRRTPTRCSACWRPTSRCAMPGCMRPTTSPPSSARAWSSRPGRRAPGSRCRCATSTTCARRSTGPSRSSATPPPPSG